MQWVFEQERGKKVTKAELMLRSIKFEDSGRPLSDFSKSLRPEDLTDEALNLHIRGMTRARETVPEDTEYRKKEHAAIKLEIARFTSEQHRRTGNVDDS